MFTDNTLQKTPLFKRLLVGLLVCYKREGKYHLTAKVRVLHSAFCILAWAYS